VRKITGRRRVGGTSVRSGGENVRKEKGGERRGRERSIYWGGGVQGGDLKTNTYTLRS